MGLAKHTHKNKKNIANSKRTPGNFLLILQEIPDWKP